MLPPALRAAVIARVIALTPTTSGTAKYSGSACGLDGVVWTECLFPMTPAELPTPLELMSVWVELGDARPISTRPTETHSVIQDIALVWLYPCRAASEAPKEDFDRAWYSMSALYLHLLTGTWDLSAGFTLDRADSPALLRPQRIGDSGHLLCEVQVRAQYTLEP